MGVAFCPHCFEKQQRIDPLEQENQRLKQPLRYRQRQAERDKAQPRPRFWRASAVALWLGRPNCGRFDIGLGSLSCR